MALPTRIRYKTAPDAAAHLKVVIGMKRENLGNYIYALGEFYESPVCTKLLNQVEADLTQALTDAQALLDQYELNPNSKRMLRSLSDCERLLDKQWDKYDSAYTRANIRRQTLGMH
ncbi:hypothetical protein M407DRAFT_115485 [Tulasnella calospora MUT 4182]|uniref:Uncharacterized protein n=1 Tax=Tulasnella calospora MUT 4182 TaxID=1051891 RepID=A0A0C3MEE1_9AGAM|nr:hypothetical protein M407DRAFT_115485 [Tulasnella calospora MUT 4182]